MFLFSGFPIHALALYKLLLIFHIKKCNLCSLRFNNDLDFIFFQKSNKSNLMYHIMLIASDEDSVKIRLLKNWIHWQNGNYIPFSCVWMMRSWIKVWQFIPYFSSSLQIPALFMSGIDVCAHDIRFVEDNWESPVIYMQLQFNPLFTIWSCLAGLFIITLRIFFRCLVLGV